MWQAFGGCHASLSVDWIAAVDPRFDVVAERWLQRYIP